MARHPVRAQGGCYESVRHVSTAANAAGGFGKRGVGWVPVPNVSEPTLVRRSWWKLNLPWEFTVFVNLQYLAAIRAKAMLSFFNPTRRIHT